MPAPENITAPPIVPAATLLLLREHDSRVEVLMTRRQEGLRFMGGMWVFPGGRVDPPDCGLQAAALVAAPSSAASPAMCALDGLPLAPALVLGLQVAACRETYEEAGVLLARHRDGRPPSAAELQALTSARDDAHTPGAFLDVVASADLLLDVDRLVYWSHWITPSHEPRRFDTRFFAVASPEGQVASLDRREAVELAWLAPRAVRAAAARGDMLVAPPTQLTLEDIDEAYARHGGVSAMLTSERGRATPPVMPRVVTEGATVHVLMPWDPEYARAPGEGCVPPAAYPPHLARRDSRLVFPRTAGR